MPTSSALHQLEGKRLNHSQLSFTASSKQPNVLTISAIFSFPAGKCCFFGALLSTLLPPTGAASSPLSPHSDKPAQVCSCEAAPG